MKVSGAVSRILKLEGTEHLVCYPRHLMIDDCTELGIRPIICRQERVGSGIADGISRATGGRRIGVFAMQGGPGVENAFAGAAQAFGDNVPILLLPGGAAVERNHVRPTFSAVDNYHHVTKLGAQLNLPNRTPELMRHAYNALRNGRPGPALIELPNDVIEQEIADDFAYTPVKRVRSAPDPADVRAAVAAILKSKRPVIHAGQGVLYADATRELVAFAEAIGAPVLTTNTGKGAFPETHSLAVGAAVHSAPKALTHFLNGADYVIAVGSSMTRTPWGPRIPDGKRFIHLTNDPQDLNKEFADEVAILGDAKLALQALVDEVGKQKRPGAETVVDEIRKVKEEWVEEWRPQLTSSETPINQYRILHDLMRTVDADNTILTHDSGSQREHYATFWETTQPHGYLGWGKSTQLGHGLGVIMGAKLAHPDKLCINIMGDASMGMVGMDLETAVRNRIGILTIVCNNGAMAGERNSMPKSVEKHNALDLGGNYAEVAKALGEWSVRVTQPDEIVRALTDAIEVTRSGEPALVEFVVKQNYSFSRY